MALAALLDQGLALLPMLQVTASGGLEAARDNSSSVVERIMGADPIVKGVMAVLSIASVWSWAVAIDKFFAVGAAKSRAKRFEQAFWSGQPVDEMSDRVSDRGSDAMARVFAAGSREWREARRSQSVTEPQFNAMVERARALMQVAVTRETVRLENGLQTLAIIASSAPFVGLFGTVIGIMNAFNAIDPTQQINLGVVGPAIAEALLATAIGIFAAVPALIFYNKFSSDIGKFAERLDLFAQEFAVRMSRRLTERGQD
jgi:biopolymer transport protein TolQ